MTHEIQWEEAQRICDLPSVDEMIHTLVHDATNDNAVCLVREILKQGCATSKEASDHTEDALDMVSPVNQSLTTDPCGACGGDGVLAGSECGFCDGKNADRTVKESLQVATPAQPQEQPKPVCPECRAVFPEIHGSLCRKSWLEVAAPVTEQPASKQEVAEQGFLHDAVTDKTLDDLAIKHKLLEWNRAQANPPIRIATEYAVAGKVLELTRCATSKPLKRCSGTCTCVDCIRDSTSNQAERKEV